MNNSNIPQMPAAPLPPGMPDRTAMTSGNIDVTTGQPEIETNTINSNETLPATTKAEIPVTYAEPVKFDVPVNEAPAVATTEAQPIIAQSEDLLAQPQSPIIGTDGPSQEMIKAAGVVYDKEPLNVGDLEKMSGELYPPVQD